MARAHSVDDYLEAIYFLATPVGEYGPVVKEAPVPAARVAEMLHVTPPTASEMMKRLEADGLIERGPRKGPLLTERGRAEAERVGAPPPHHRALPHRLHGLLGGRVARPRRRDGRRLQRRDGGAARRPARPPRPLPARLAGGPLARAGGEPGAALPGADRVGHSSASSAWPSTTATCSTGSTSRAWCRAPTSRCGAWTPPRGSSPCAIDGEERAIGERAAAGLYVLPIPA